LPSFSEQEQSSRPSTCTTCNGQDNDRVVDRDAVISAGQSWQPCILLIESCWHCGTAKKYMYLQILLFYVTRVPLPFHKSYLLKSAPMINASFYPSLKYHKHSCISRTILHKFWAKNRGCGLYTRPLLSEEVKGLVGVINWTENLQWTKIKHILRNILLIIAFRTWFMPCYPLLYMSSTYMYMYCTKN